MAAQDMFDAVIRSLTKEELKQLNDYLRAKGEDLRAARSEDARVRLVNEFLNEVHDILVETR